MASRAVGGCAAATDGALVAVHFDKDDIRVLVAKCAKVRRNGATRSAPGTKKIRAEKGGR